MGAPICWREAVGSWESFYPLPHQLLVDERMNPRGVMAAGG